MDVYVTQCKRDYLLWMINSRASKKFCSFKYIRCIYAAGHPRFILFYGALSQKIRVKAGVLHICEEDGIRMMNLLRKLFVMYKASSGETQQRKQQALVFRKKNTLFYVPLLHWTCVWLGVGNYYRYRNPWRMMIFSFLGRRFSKIQRTGTNMSGIGIYTGQW